MSRGTGAFIVMLSVTLSFSMLVGLGVPAALNTQYASQYGDDVQAVADAIGSGQEASNTGASVFTDFTVGAARSLQAGWHLVTNTDAVIILLFGVPRVIAWPVGTFFQVSFGLTFLGFVRGAFVDQ